MKPIDENKLLYLLLGVFVITTPATIALGLTGGPIVIAFVLTFAYLIGRIKIYERRLIFNYVGYYTKQLSNIS